MLTGGLPPGPDGVRELFETIGPVEEEWAIEDVIAEGEKVVVRATTSCVQESFLGLPGLGRRQTFTPRRSSTGSPTGRSWRPGETPTISAGSFSSGAHRAGSVRPIAAS